MEFQDPDPRLDRQGDEPRRSQPWTGQIWLRYLAWMGAAGWSVYLVWGETDSHGGSFGAAVRVMGSLGILYLLYLVTKPLRTKPLEIGPVKTQELLSERASADETRTDPAARAALVTITLALAIGGLLYRLSIDNYLHQSSAFFIGVPTVLAITLAFTPRAKSATGMIVKGMTLALLLSGVVFYEGVVCILMAAPIFYLVGIAIGVPIDRARRKRRSEGKVLSVVGIGLLMMSFEGVMPATSFSAHETVKASRVVEASEEEVRRSLSSRPDFSTDLPFYLKLGFPRPRVGRGQGLDVGDRRTIFFGKESPMEPMDVDEAGGHHHDRPRRSGVLELTIVESQPGRVVFEPTRDATAFTHWISWGRSKVEWRAIDADTTKLTWTLQFERRLSPAWYFEPWQRYAAEKAAGYLIDTVATP